MFNKASLNMLFISFTACLLLCCNEPNNETSNTSQTISIFSADSLLHLVNGVFYDKNSEPFNGKIIDVWPNHRIKSIQSIIKGKPGGNSKTFYTNGALESARW